MYYLGLYSVSLGVMYDFRSYPFGGTTFYLVIFLAADRLRFGGIFTTYRGIIPRSEPNARSCITLPNTYLENRRNRTIISCGYLGREAYEAPPSQLFGMLDVQHSNNTTVLKTYKHMHTRYFVT